MGEIIRASYAGPKPDYAICGKSFKEHSMEEQRACAIAERAMLANDSCPSCEKLIGEHTHEEIGCA
jgi:hypothetical protein